MQRCMFLLATAAFGLGAGCMPVANYHSARTLGAGESSWGLTFSATTYTKEEVDESTGETETDAFTLPGVIPEVAYHVGITDDFELGGRVAPGFLYGELDAKYRFLHSDGLHLAVAPAVGQAFFFAATATIARLPLLLTYELHPRLALNTGVNATFWNVTGVDGSSEDIPFTDDSALTTMGFSIGLEVTGESGFIRPSLEITRGLLGDDNGGEPFQIAAVVLHMGTISGREMKKLDEMDRKLDEINQKLSWRDRRKPAP